MTVSIIALLTFFSVSIASIVTRHISRHWNVCFLLCSCALGGWMVYYAGSLRLGGEVMFYRNNLILFYVLTLSVLISAIARFSSPKRYIAIAVLLVSLVAFNVAVPGFLYAFRLFRKN
jgi:hypothetical protein